jgi:hypothetical protein
MPTRPPAPQLTIIFSMVEGMAPTAIALQSRVPLTGYAGQPVSSCLAKCNHRVHFRRTSCWEIASQRGHCK